VISIINLIVEEAAWGNLPILADALQDAGCEDDVILDHLRKHAHAPGSHCHGGCWYGTCWVLQSIADKEQKIRAVYEEADGHVILIPVVNPGNESGHTYLVQATFGNHGVVFCVESRYSLDSVDVLVDSDEGKGWRIRDEDLKDYIDHPGTDESPPEYSCYFTDSNNAYDPNDFHIRYTGSEIYVGPGTPLDGIKSDLYNDNYRNFCKVCQRQFYQLPELPDFFCSKECLALHESKYDYLDDP